MDLSGVEEGQTITVKWRGKPVFIKCVLARAFTCNYVCILSHMHSLLSKVMTHDGFSTSLYPRLFSQR